MSGQIGYRCRCWRAADLGVKAMIYLDGTWLAQGEPAKA